MIKISRLVQEFVGRQLHRESDKSDAAEQAHGLGLISKGWGRWADPQTDEIVAKTVHGHLVKIDNSNRDDEEFRSDNERYYTSNKYREAGPRTPDGEYPDEEPEWLSKDVEDALYNGNYFDRQGGAYSDSPTYTNPRDITRQDLYPGYNSPKSAKFYGDNPKPKSSSTREPTRSGVWS